jgi:DNA-binding MarR family transcriptional regulator
VTTGPLTHPRGRRAGSAVGSSNAEQLLAGLDGLAAGARHLTSNEALGASATMLLKACLEHGPTPQSALVQQLGVSRASVSQLIRRLESAGMVCRRPHPDNGRTLLVEATRAGRTAYESAHHDRIAALDDLLADLPASSRRAIDAALPALSVLCDAMVLPHREGAA